jgi:hypothetical protein
MIVIQSFLGFVECETTSKNRVNPSTIKSIPEDNVLTSLIVYSTLFSTGQSCLESLGLEIYNDIPIPNIISANKEKRFIG